MASRESGYKLEKLRVNDLEYDLKNPRFKGISSGLIDQVSAEVLVEQVKGIDELEESVSKIGIIEPPYVVRKNGKYRVIEGNQRLFVLRKLREKSVPTPPDVSWDSISCFVIPKGTSELEIMTIQAVLQQTKKDWPPEGEAAHFHEMVESEVGDTEDDCIRRVAEKVKVAPGYIRKRIAAWKQWRSYAKEMKLAPKEAEGQYSYFFEMKKKTKEWFDNPENKRTYYRFITPTADASQKIRTVKKSEGLDDFDKIVDKPRIIKKLKDEPEYTLAEAVAEAEIEDPKLAVKGLKAAKTLADSLARASKEQVDLIRRDASIYPSIRRLYDVIDRRFMKSKS